MTKNNNTTRNSTTTRRRTIKSKLYNKLSEGNTFSVRTTLTTQAGVKIEDQGNKKGSIIEVILPSTTITGAKRSVKVQMTGRQARALYETLSRYYGE